MNFEGAENCVSKAILSGVDGADKVKCTGCGVTFSVRHGGTKDVLKHLRLGYTDSPTHLQPS